MNYTALLAQAFLAAAFLADVRCLLRDAVPLLAWPRRPCIPLLARPRMPLLAQRHILSTLYCLGVRLVRFRALAQPEELLEQAPAPPTSLL